MVIYADILVVINLFVNYFLLLITKRILRVCVRRIRILCGAVFGGLYSLIIFAPALPLAVTALFHMAAVGILVLISFPTNTVKAYFKAYTSLFAVNFRFPGPILTL